MSLAENIAAAMLEIDLINFDSSNQHGKYRYASADAVYSAVRPVLAKHKLVVEVSVGDIATVSCRGVEFMILTSSFRFVGEEAWTAVPIPLNTGRDRPVFMPQAVQAALTMAQKYWLRSRLLLATGEQDADSHQASDYTVAPQLVSTPDLEALRDMAAKADVTQEQICERFGVSQLAKLPASVVDRVRHVLLKTIEKNAASADDTPPQDTPPQDEKGMF